ncbi:hypothetical protein KY290_037250 [Solanum tuberosum]|uniref:DUF4283 domain-containing protein n=1 Tax=Solanum tuberosum TaxID=4113 RepID=A0ABQ7TYS3_SOLTU|nr:hypothetical protein KY285_036552 [Solanum tuberosum]KAH0738545.1 hypothetical protein KY290_037250 [Solanum tuberosum]
MKISKGTLMWLCNSFKEASVIKGKSFKTWKCKDISISIYCSLKFNKFGRFISVIQLMAMIVYKSRTERKVVSGERIATKKYYRKRNGAMETKARHQHFPIVTKYPPEQKLETGFNRPGGSRRDAEHILLGDWRRRNHPLLLEWWKPTAGAFHADTIFDWFWVWILGLPLQLWNDKVMKQIRDLCGGWLETEEETQLKNHLRWARLRVMGPRGEKIPSSIEISDRDLIFTLPVWIDAPVRYRKKEEDGLMDR